MRKVRYNLQINASPSDGCTNISQTGAQRERSLPIRISPTASRLSQTCAVCSPSGRFFGTAKIARVIIVEIRQEPVKTPYHFSG